VQLGTFSANLIDSLSQAHKQPSVYDPYHYGLVAAIQDAGRHLWCINDHARDLIMNTTIPDELLPDLQLPFPKMLVEYQAYIDQDLIAQDPMRVASPQRILVIDDDGAGGLDVQPLWHDGRKWCAYGFKSRVSRDAIQTASEWCTRHKNYEYEFDIRHPNLPRLVDVVPGYGEAALHYAQQSGRAEALAEVACEILCEVSIVLGLMAVLACDNCPVERVVPSRFKQERRKSQRRRPLPEYRILKLGTLPTTTEGMGQSGGKKRPHWRRGHIRNQPTSRGVVRRWIKPVLINAGAGDHVSRPVVVA